MSKPEGLEVLHELVRRADVFLTSFMPASRARLGIDVDDIRAVNPKIVYARGAPSASWDPRPTRAATT